MLIDGMIKAALLDVAFYDKIEKDLKATTQALYVVLIVSLAGGISGAISSPRNSIPALVGGILFGVLGWVVWSLVTYFIGTRVFNGQATPGELLRCVGFANSPDVLRILGFVPVLGGLVVMVAGIWSLVAGVVAVRQALEIDTTKAILTVVLGWVAMLLIGVVLAILGLGGLLSL